MYSFSYDSQTKCFRTRFDMHIFSHFSMWDLCPIFVPILQLHPVFSITVTIWSSFSAMEQTPYTCGFRKQVKHRGTPHSNIFHLHNAYVGVHSRRHIRPVTRPRPVPHSDGRVRTEPRHSKLNFSGYVIRRNCRERVKSEWKRATNTTASEIASFMTTQSTNCLHG
jgi:hypothetical protein